MLAHFGVGHVFFHVGEVIVRVALGLLEEALFHAAVGFALAEAVDRPAAGEGDDPAERLALLRIVGGGTVPDFHEDLLQHVIGLRVVVQDAHDERLQRGGVAVVQVADRFLLRRWIISMSCSSVRSSASGAVSGRG